MINRQKQGIKHLQVPAVRRRSKKTKRSREHISENDEKEPKGKNYKGKKAHNKTKRPQKRRMKGEYKKKTNIKRKNQTQNQTEKETKSTKQ